MFIRTLFCLAVTLLPSANLMASIQKTLPSVDEIFDDAENLRLFHSLGREVLKPKPMSEKSLERILRRQPKPRPYVAPELPEESRKAMAFIEGLRSTVPKPKRIQSDLLYRKPGAKAWGVPKGTNGTEFPSVYTMGQSHRPIQLERGVGIGFAAGLDQQFMTAYSAAFMFEFHEELSSLRGDRRQRRPFRGTGSGIRSLEGQQKHQLQRGAEAGLVDGRAFAKAIHSGDLNSFDSHRQSSPGPSRQLGEGVHGGKR